MTGYPPLSDIDAYFGKIGPCLVCGKPGLDQRHRTIEAIADRVAGGEDVTDVALDYGISHHHVIAAALYAPHYEAGGTDMSESEWRAAYDKAMEGVREANEAHAFYSNPDNQRAGQRRERGTGTE